MAQHPELIKTDKMTTNTPLGEDIERALISGAGRSKLGEEASRSLCDKKNRDIGSENHNQKPRLFQERKRETKI